MTRVINILLVVLFCVAVAPFVAADEAALGADSLGRAARLCGEKRYAEAEPLLKAAIEADPSGAEAHYRLAIVYLKTNRPAEAAREYLKTAELDEKLARELRLMNPMLSLSKPAKGIATESGFITAPAPVPAAPASAPASDEANVKNNDNNNNK